MTREGNFRKFINTGQLFSRLMVREKKMRFKDIEKLHELIDSASLPKQKIPSAYEEEKLQALRKRLSDNSLKDRKQVFSSEELDGESDNLKPRVIIHKKEERKKTDEKVIQIDLKPREITKEKELPEYKFALVKENPFSKEEVFEIEKVPVSMDRFFRDKSLEPSDKSDLGKKSLLAISAQKGKESTVQTSRSTRTQTAGRETTEERDVKSKGIFSQMIHPKKEKQNTAPLVSQEPKVDIPQFEPIEFTAIESEKEKWKTSGEEIIQEKDRKQKRMDDKQTKKQAREKEKDTQQLTKDQPVVEDREEKPRPEFLKKGEDQSQQRKNKKEEEKQTRLQLKQKKREAKQLAKEHDRKLKLEWLEFKHAQKKNQKKKILEQKKAIALAKQKQREEQRLLKQQKEKLRLTQIATLKKEKEKQQKQELKIKQDAAEARETQLEKQRFLRKQEDHLRFEQQERQKEKKKPIEPLSDKRKTTEYPRKLSGSAQLKQEKKEKDKQERLELKKKQKEQKIHEKQVEKQRKKLFGKKSKDKEQLKQKKLEEKQIKQEAEEKEREAESLLREEQKKKEHLFLLNEKLAKEKEKQEQKIKKIDEKRDRIYISNLGMGKTKQIGGEKSNQQKNTMELVRIAAEEKELRKTKAFKRKMEKERKKKERDEQQSKKKENDLDKKKMDIQFKEEITKQKMTKQPQPSNPFSAFDSINQETARLLCNVGYTSIEKLRKATASDLVKIGLKRKNAQRIIAECEEFVEWEVIDETDHF